LSDFDCSKLPVRITNLPVKDLKMSNFQDDTFHYSIAPIMKFMQNISIMPLENIKRNEPEAVTFKWKSMRIFYSLAFFAYGTFEASFMYLFLEEQGGITAKNIGDYFDRTKLDLIITLNYFESWSYFLLLHHSMFACVSVYRT
jgi:hypothetical protein